MKHLVVPFALVVITLCGCGGGNVVNGTVTFDDGTPLTEGSVVFIGPNTQAVGGIKSDGTYTMYENKPGDGVAPGHYQVTVAAQTGGNSDDGSPLVNLVNPKFSNPDTSGLTCDVKGATTFNITVTKP